MYSIIIIHTWINCASRPYITYYWTYVTMEAYPRPWNPFRWFGLNQFRTILSDLVGIQKQINKRKKKPPLIMPPREKFMGNELISSWSLGSAQTPNGSKQNSSLIWKLLPRFIVMERQNGKLRRKSSGEHREREECWWSPLRAGLAELFMDQLEYDDLIFQLGARRFWNLV